MNKLFSVCAAALSLVIASCGGQKNDMTADGVPVIDWSKQYPTERIDLGDVADIEYVALDTNDSCLIQNATDVAVGDDLLVVADVYNGAAFVFDRNGRYQHTISHQGGGPEEYRFMNAFVADIDGREAIVYDKQTNRLLRYGFDGRFHGAAPLGSDHELIRMTNLNDSSLIAYDATGLTLLPAKDNVDPRRYVLIDKKSGRVTPIPFEVEHPRGANVLWDLNPGTLSVGLRFSSLCQAGKDKAMISDIAVDTVYSYDGQSFSPLFVNANVDAASYAVPDVVTLEIPASENAFFQYLRVLDIDRDGVKFDEKKGGMYRYNYADGSLTRVEFNNPIRLNDDEPLSLGGVTVSIEGNMKSVAIPTERLLEALEENDLVEDVSKLVKEREPDANPVLMLVKFR